MPSPTGFDLKVFDNVKVRDDHGSLVSASSVPSRPECTMNCKPCPLHRTDRRPGAALPALAQSMLSRLKSKAHKAVSALGASRHKSERQDLAIVCKDFRYPVTTRSGRFMRQGKTPCCLLLAVEIRWYDNEQQKIWDYLLEVYRFVAKLGSRGTVAVEVFINILMEDSTTLVGGEEFLLASLRSEDLFPAPVKHVDLIIAIEHLEPYTVHLHLFEGSREDGAEQFRGQTTHNTIRTDVD